MKPINNRKDKLNSKKNLTFSANAKRTLSWSFLPWLSIKLPLYIRNIKLSRLNNNYFFVVCLSFQQYFIDDNERIPYHDASHSTKSEKHD